MISGFSVGKRTRVMFGDLLKSWICETAETQNVSLVLNTSALPAEGGGEVGFKCLVS